MYDPLLGRMLSPDNAIQAPDKTENYNRYSYCMNNPLKYTDPTGNDYDYLHQDWIDKWADKQAYDSRVINGYAGSFAGSGDWMLRQMKLQDYFKNEWSLSAQQRSDFISGAGFMDVPVSDPFTGAEAGPSGQDIVNQQSMMTDISMMNDMQAMNNEAMMNGVGGHYEGTRYGGAIGLVIGNETGITYQTDPNASCVAEWVSDPAGYGGFDALNSQSGGESASNNGIETGERVAGAIGLAADAHGVSFSVAKVLSEDAGIALKGIARTGTVVGAIAGGLPAGYNIYESLKNGQTPNWGRDGTALGLAALGLASEFFGFGEIYDLTIGTGTLVFDIYTLHADKINK